MAVHNSSEANNGLNTSADVDYVSQFTMDAGTDTQKLKIDTEAASSLNSVVKTQTGELETVSSALSGIITGLQSCWHGAAATSNINDMSQKLGALDELIEVLKSNSTTLDNIINEYVNIEKNNTLGE